MSNVVDIQVFLVDITRFFFFTIYVLLLNVSFFSIFLTIYYILSRLFKSEVNIIYFFLSILNISILTLPQITSLKNNLKFQDCLFI